MSSHTSGGAHCGDLRSDVDASTAALYSLGRETKLDNGTSVVLWSQPEIIIYDREFAEKRGPGCVLSRQTAPQSSGSSAAALTYGMAARCWMLWHMLQVS